ncbi:MAG: hypothetical protein HY402_02005 [Elusimicrobia bacterium]|nr:hypothetical protein [Elusimicrobiota bacterium]
MEPQDSEFSRPPYATREVWVELRTPEERIEGMVKVPAHSRCRRISDFIWHADRGALGILHLANATVFNGQTNAVKFRKSALGVNKNQVIYFSLLNPEKEKDTQQVWDIQETPHSSWQEILHNN